MIVINFGDDLGKNPLRRYTNSILVYVHVSKQTKMLVGKSLRFIRQKGGCYLMEDSTWVFSSTNSIR